MDRRIWGRWLMVSGALAIVICIVGVNSDGLALGNAVNMLTSYGHLAEGIRVIERSDGEPWIFRGPSIKVLDAPNWSKPAIAKLFGIDESFVADNYSYVFLKIARSRDAKRMVPSVEEFKIDRAVFEHAANVRINDTASVDSFISQFGTHYVSSFATGDFIYQVFVDTPSNFRYLQKHVPRTGLAGLDANERKYMFSTRYRLHVGKILSASGSPSLEAWAEVNLEGLHRNARNDRYSTIVEIYSNRQLSTELDDLLEDKALLQMELEILTPVFTNPEIRESFDKYVRDRLHQMSLNDK